MRKLTLELFECSKAFRHVLCAIESNRTMNDGAFTSWRDADHMIEVYNDNDFSEFASVELIYLNAIASGDVTPEIRYDGITQLADKIVTTGAEAEYTQRLLGDHCA